MSYGYQEYGGNPYSSTGQSGYGYGSSNSYGSANPGRYDAPNARGQDVELGRYGNSDSYGQQPHQPPLSQLSSASDYSKPVGGAGGAGGSYGGGYGGYNQPGQQEPGAQQQLPLMGTSAFLEEVDDVNKQIREFEGDVINTESLQQQVLGASDLRPQTALDAQVANTQVLVKSISERLRRLERDAKRSPGDRTKDSQIRTTMSRFQGALEQYKQKRNTFETQFREGRKRQFLNVNPSATEEDAEREVAKLGRNEGVYESAFMSSRQANATTTLGNVRARHREIQQIEESLTELSKMFGELNQAVVIQDVPVTQIENQTARVEDDTRQGNTQLDRGIDHARRARKLKWICFAITVLIIIILAVVLGIVFGVVKKQTS